MGYYSEVQSYQDTISLANPMELFSAEDLILFLRRNAPYRSVKELIKTAPCLGVCYGMQLICHQMGGRVRSSSKGAYGKTKIKWREKLILNMSEQFVWMSHGDIVEKAPPGMKLLAENENRPSAYIDESNKILTFQFHPEVHHTEKGPGST